jgi:hypothetical protein
VDYWEFFILSVRLLSAVSSRKNPNDSNTGRVLRRMVKLVSQGLHEGPRYFQPSTL